MHVTVHHDPGTTPRIALETGSPVGTDRKETLHKPVAICALRTLFSADFLIGAALNLKQFYEEDARSVSIIKTQFNAITPENILKWESVHPELNSYTFEAADRYVAFGEKNHMFIVGHTLVWHNQTQDRATFSLIASRERQHGERIPKIAKFKLGVLPVAAIYGGNASGKTNLFKALNFAKGLIIKGTQPYSLIAVDTFRLGNSQKIDQPAHFDFELLIGETIYAFSFSVTRKAILEEKLVHISGNNEKTLYHRVGGEPNFDPSLREDQSLLFAYKGTRDNQLFLTNSVSQKIDAFKPVYDWFKDSLELIAPDSRFESFEQFLDEGHPLYATMNNMLPRLDTGIAHLGGEEIPFENLPMPEPIKMKLREELAEGTTVRLLAEPMNERFVVTRRNGELISKKLVTYHLNSDGSETKFDMRQESDGSQRVIDLLPAFLEISAPQSKKVYVIDEVDRSLHTLLMRRLLEAYLSTCSNDSRAQLLVTTHNVLLMDQDLLRRDEMWIAERNAQGVSSLLSFSEYKDVRYDKDIRKSYLQGRLGGIPLLNGVINHVYEYSELEEFK